MKIDFKELTINDYIELNEALKDLSNQGSIATLQKLTQSKIQRSHNDLQSKAKGALTSVTSSSLKTIFKSTKEKMSAIEFNEQEYKLLTGNDVFHKFIEDRQLNALIAARGTDEWKRLCIKSTSKVSKMRTPEEIEQLIEIMNGGNVAVGSQLTDQNSQEFKDMNQVKKDIKRLKILIETEDKVAEIELGNKPATCPIKQMICRHFLKYTHYVQGSTEMRTELNNEHELYAYKSYSVQDELIANRFNSFMYATDNNTMMTYRKEMWSFNENVNFNDLEEDIKKALINEFPSMDSPIPIEGLKRIYGNLMDYYEEKDNSLKNSFASEIYKTQITSDEKGLLERLVNKDSKENVFSQRYANALKESKDLLTSYIVIPLCPAAKEYLSACYGYDEKFRGDFLIFECDHENIAKHSNSNLDKIINVYDCKLKGCQSFEDVKRKIMNDINYLSNIPIEDIYSTFEIHPNRASSSQSVSSQTSAGSVSSQTLAGSVSSKDFSSVNTISTASGSESSRDSSRSHSSEDSSKDFKR